MTFLSIPIVRVGRAGFARHQISRIRSPPVVRTPVFARNNDLGGRTEEKADGAGDGVAVEVFALIDAVVSGVCRAENVGAPVHLILHAEYLRVAVLLARIKTPVGRIVWHTQGLVDG